MKKSLTSLSFLALVLATSVTGCAGHPHHGQGPKVPVSESESLFVTGEGEASARPDRVRINLGVEAKGDTVEAAFADSTKRVNDLLQALLTSGVAERDIKTGQFNISQIRDTIFVDVPVPPAPLAVPAAPTKGAAAPTKSGKMAAAVAEAPASLPTRREERWVERYVVNTSFEVTFDDVAKTSSVISAAVRAGANQSWGINFELSDPKPLAEKARESALNDAKARAEQLAKVSGVKLGRVLSIVEGGGGQAPIPMPRFAMMKSTDGPAIEGGETKIHASVSVVYAIDRE